MALEILYGKQLKTKDSVLFTKIKECIDRQEDVLYIVPEQYSFNADKTLLESLGEKYSHLTETVNFKRLAKIVNQKYQPNQLDYIDDEIKNLVLYKILKANAASLLTVKNRHNSPDSVMIFKNILSECKGYLIGHDVFEQMKNKLEPTSFLYQKICDLDLILTQYQAEISDKFRDFEDSFQTLAECILEHNLYQGYHVFIDNFMSFSPAEYLVISALLKNAKTVSVTLLLDDFSKKEAGDLFYPTYQTYENLNKLVKKQNLTLTATRLEDTQTEFFTDLFDGVSQSAPTLEYSMTDTKTQQEEVRFVADTIQKKVAEGASYSNFTVLTGDLARYRDDIEKTFLQASIPCFMDQKSPLTENPLSRIFLNLFAMILSDYRKDAVLEYLKSICSVYPVHREVCILEELLLRFRLERWDLSDPDRWQKKCEFIQSQHHYFAENMQLIQLIYEKFLHPVIQHFSGKISYFSAFRKYAEALQLEQTVKLFLEEKEAAFRNETVTAYNTILTAIKNIDVLIQGDNLSPADYYNLLKQSLELYQSGEIPNTLDTVTVSDIERGRSLLSPHVFIIGMNDGVTPKSNNNTTYLSDLERETICELTGIDLPTSLNQNCASNLSLYRAFLTAEKHLYLSKNMAESDDAKQMPCYLWSRLEQFCSVTQYTDAAVSRSEYAQAAVMAFKNPYKQRLNPAKAPDFLLQNQRSEALLPVWEQLDQMQDQKYFEPQKKLSRKIMDIKYQKQLNTSVSRLETYQKCGYAYFINYILRISEREDVSYDFRKTGSIVHALFEQFSKCMKKDGLTWETVAAEYIETSLDKLVPKEIMRLFPDLSLFNPRTKYLTKKIKRLLRSAISFIKEHFQNGEFVPIGYEVSLGDDGIPPLTIALEDGSVMQIYGIIDRCDAAKVDDRLYVRIVDYKSSPKEFKFTLIKEGIQLQLLTYLRTVVKNGGEYLNFAGEILPGAAFYTSFGDSLVSFAERPAPDQVQAEIRRKFTMKGFVLNDDSLIHAIDRHLENEVSYQSEICDIKTDSKGQYKLKNFLFLEEFNRLLNDCEETLQTIGNKVMSGDIAIKPYRYGKETGCDWCPYGSVCMFDPKMHDYRRLKKLSKEDYFQKQPQEETAGESDGN